MCIMYFCNSVIHLVILLSIVSIVRPHMEYAAPVWDPDMTKDQDLLASTQKFACNMMTKNWEATMSFCNWQTYPLLQTEGCTLNCVLCTKLCTTWLYTSHQILLYLKSLDCMLAHLLPDLGTYCFLKSFVPHAVSHWNSLPEPVVSSPSFATFKHTHLQIECIYYMH